MIDRTKQLEEENKKLQELLDAAVKQADSLQKEVDDRLDVSGKIEKLVIDDMISQMDTDFLKAVNKVYSYHHGYIK